MNAKSPTKTRSAKSAKGLKPEKMPEDKETSTVIPAQPIKETDRGDPEVVDIHPPGPPTEKEGNQRLPQTPASYDHLSPFVAGPEQSQRELKDTPPPPIDGSTMVTGPVRPSRRSRGAVSYAEPNLRDKMRRPTKDLVGAVEGERRRGSKSYSGQEEKISDSNDGNIRSESEAKNSNDAGVEDFQGEPASPMERKPEGLLLELPSNVMTDRKRRTLSASKADLVPNESQAPSMSSRAISTLVAGTKSQSQRRQRKSKNLGAENEEGLPGADSGYMWKEADDLAFDTSTEEGILESQGAPQNPEHSTGINTKLRRTRSSGPVDTLPKGGVNKPVNDSATYSWNEVEASQPVDSSHGRDEYNMGMVSDKPQGRGEIRRVQRLAASRRRSMML